MTSCIGIDPGLASLGFAFVQRDASGPRVVRAGAIVTDSDQTTAARAQTIWHALDALVRDTRPDVVGVELQEQALVGQLQQQRGSLGTLRVQRIVGLVDGIVASWSLPLVEVTPQQVKIAMLGVGAGRAEKRQVTARMRELHCEPGVRITEHSADAVATALHALRVWELLRLSPVSAARERVKSARRARR